MAFLGSFIQYVVILIILAAVAVGGIFTGKALRKRKDAKDLAASVEEIQEEK